LAFDPNSELRILSVLGWDVAVAVFLSEGTKLIQAFLPKGRMRVPNETKMLESALAFVSHSGVLTGLLERVLVSLAFDPAG
jgi:hypothetical protein